MPQDLMVQELEAKLFECNEELKIYRRNEKQLEFLARENRQLQNEKLCLRETLHKSIERISCLEQDKDLLKSDLYGAQLSEQAAELDMKKLRTMIDELRTEVKSLKGTIEDLTATKKDLDQQIIEITQAANLAEESGLAKRKALEEQILALKKVNSKLEEALQRKIDSTSENGNSPSLQKLI